MQKRAVIHSFKMIRTCEFVTLILCLAAVSFAQCKKLHEYMTPEEVMSVFHTRHDSVPEYEVVPVRHKRNTEPNLQYATTVELKAFDQDLKLYLNPTEGILASQNTPVWTVRSDRRYPEGLRYHRIPDVMRDLHMIYQDMANRAAIVVTPTPSGHLIFDGTINDHFVVRPLPPRVLHHVSYADNAQHENATNSDDLVSTYHHVVYRIPKANKDQDFNITIPDHLVNVRAKRAAPDVIYPEVLIVIDYHEFILFGRDIKQTVRYLLAYWNGVDLRYRLLSKPRIRLNIAGIIIPLDADAVPYLEKNVVNMASVNADLALEQMGQYFYRETRFPRTSFDMVVAMTRLDMCNMFENYCDPATLGYAYVAGACNRNETSKATQAVAIVEDNGGFSGIIPTAHEIGHLIGARHDGNFKHAKECSPGDGFIMTGGLMLHENGFQWSNCSINAFYKFLNEDRAKCLHNEPVKGEKLTRQLPGKLMSLDAQCRRLYPGSMACNRDASVCTRLECSVPGSHMGDCRAIAAAAEGSPCGNGFFCLHGKCVVEGPLTRNKQISRQHVPPFRIQIIRPVWWLYDPVVLG